MPATDVDHIINKAKGGSDDPSNLQSLCRKCHRSKTANE
ncbi:HNH endonuclease signature motif containing protein [Psychrobacter celer]